MNPHKLVERALTEAPLSGERVSVLAVGKAAAGMSAGALQVLGALVHGGLALIPDARIGERAGPLGPLDTMIGEHPVPGAGSERAGRHAMSLAQSTSADRGLLVLLSGGASSLMVMPADGVTLSDKRMTTELLLRGGADIKALNTVRKHISAIKAGWLAARSPGRVRTLAISDVVGDDPSYIGSGPTVADPTTFADALRVLDAHGGRRAYPETVVGRLERGAIGALEETPKPGDPRLAKTTWQLIGSRFDAMVGAAAAARERGYAVGVLDAPVLGDAAAAGRGYVARLRGVVVTDQPQCLISSGETTVHVRGPGRGGRNQEFAAAVAEPLRQLETYAALVSCGTDGIDGPTDAAGAFVDSSTAARAAAAGLDARAFLDSNDTFHFFEPLGDLIRTGPTGTNVGDLQVCIVAKAGSI